jgi:hypothetical protein
MPVSENFFECVEGAGADVAIDDADRGQCEGCKTGGGACLSQDSLRPPKKEHLSTSGQRFCSSTARVAWACGAMATLLGDDLGSPCATGALYP